MSGEDAADSGASVAPGTLYVVATPIGNLEDITLRAIRVLREVDLVAAEDTRRTRLLLDHLGIRKPMVSFHDAKEQREAPRLVARLVAGESIAIVSDAGTPLIADPGYRLVGEAAAAGVRVVPIPGPSSPIALLSVAGLPTDRFTFVGFLPAKASKRRRFLHELREHQETIVLLETAPRIAASLRDVLEVWGDRPAVLGRELTKKFEEVRRGTVGELVAWAEGGERVRGEIVVGVGGAPVGSVGASDDGESVDGVDEERLDGEIEAALERGEAPTAIARRLAAEMRLERRRVYERVVARGNRDQDPPSEE